MNVQNPIRALGFERPLHRAVFAGLIARHLVAMRNLEALLPDDGLACCTELTLVSGICRKDAVVGVEHDDRLGLVFEERDQGPHLRLCRPW